MQEGVDISSIGKKIILPSTFTSSLCFMHKNLQNALALLCKSRGSNLFITFTANPQWREVKEALLLNQTPAQQPDIVACIFHLKVKSLINDIMQKSVFGKVEAFVYTIEYQKRGLPHIHLIVFLECSSHISMTEAVDQIVSTEFPNEIANPHLFELVKQFMVHGPCGFGQSSPCLDANGKCTKHFSKSFHGQTEITGDSYVQTCRHDTGQFVAISNSYADNRYVISHSPYLLLKYNTHINVKCTAGFHTVKYIYKVLLHLLTLIITSCILFTKISWSSPLWTSLKFSLCLNLSSSLVNVFNQEKKNCLLVNKNYITMDFFFV